jgi:hypothetical protein
MSAAQDAERLALARLEVTRACNLLIAPTPDALNICQDALQRAVAVLTEMGSPRAEFRADPATEPQVLALRADVLRAGWLLQNLDNFYRGWERILGTMSGGYTANGDPAPVSRLGRLCCRG